jgi:hypothetical protein
MQSQTSRSLLTGLPMKPGANEVDRYLKRLQSSASKGLLSGGSSLIENSLIESGGPQEEAEDLFAKSLEIKASLIASTQKLLSAEEVGSWGKGDAANLRSISSMGTGPRNPSRANLLQKPGAGQSSDSPFGGAFPGLGKSGSRVLMGQIEGDEEDEEGNIYLRRRSVLENDDGREEFFESDDEGRSQDHRNGRHGDGDDDEEGDDEEESERISRLPLSRSASNVNAEAILIALERLEEALKSKQQTGSGAPKQDGGRTKEKARGKKGKKGSRSARSKEGGDADIGEHRRP